jgi:hypothetical protein
MEESIPASQKGEHGISILFPGGKKDEDTEEGGGHVFFMGTVFDITQTEPMDMSWYKGDIKNCQNYDAAIERQATTTPAIAEEEMVLPWA